MGVFLAQFAIFAFIAYCSHLVPAIRNYETGLFVLFIIGFWQPPARRQCVYEFLASASVHRYAHAFHLFDTPRNVGITKGGFSVLASVLYCRVENIPQVYSVRHSGISPRHKL